MHGLEIWLVFVCRHFIGSQSQFAESYEAGDWRLFGTIRLFGKSVTFALFPDTMPEHWHLCDKNDHTEAKSRSPKYSLEKRKTEMKDHVKAYVLFNIVETQYRKYLAPYAVHIHATPHTHSYIRTQWQWAT